MNGRHRQDFVVADVFRQAGAYVHIPYPVAVSEQEIFILPEIRADHFDPAGGQRLLSGFRQRHLPVAFLRDLMKHGRRCPAKLECDIARVPKVVLEIVPDHLPFVTEAKNEFVEPMPRVNFHDVPEDRASPDRQHRLGTELGFFTQTRSLPATKDDNFHPANHNARPANHKDFDRKPYRCQSLPARRSRA